MGHAKPHPTLWIGTAIVLFTAVALALHGLSLWLERPPTDNRWDNGADLAVFLQPSASALEIETIGDILADDPQVRAVEFIDQQRSYQHMVDYFEADSVLAELTPDDAPPSYRVAMHDPDFPTVQVLADSFRTQPAVSNVVLRDDEAFERLQHDRTRYRPFVAAATPLLAASALLFIAGTRRGPAEPRLDGANKLVPPPPPSVSPPPPPVSPSPSPTPEPSMVHPPSVGSTSDAPVAPQ